MERPKSSVSRKAEKRAASIPSEDSGEGCCVEGVGLSHLFMCLEKGRMQNAD